MTEGGISWDTLNAYLDGELDSETARRVEQALWSPIADWPTRPPYSNG